MEQKSEGNTHEKLLKFLDKLFLVFAVLSGPVILLSNTEIKPFLMLLALIPAVFLSIRAWLQLKALRRKEKSVKPFESFSNFNLYAQLIINSIATVGNIFGAAVLLMLEHNFLW